MGLGKTLQCLAAIQRAKQKTKANLPSLIVCPTSVVSNWESEARKFFIKVNVIAYTGSGRDEKIQEIRARMERNGHDRDLFLVITSYDIARQDHEALAEIAGLYVVVDEAHHIKNPAAKRTRAIKTLNGRHKLALTGTPIQNNLQELWSLFDYVIPGFLGSRTQFCNKFGRNGRIDWDAVRHGETSLKQQIKPFVLRRLKANVARDLPMRMMKRNSRT
jgi:SNF2 family DNA or RNA helicase